MLRSVEQIELSSVIPSQAEFVLEESACFEWQVYIRYCGVKRNLSNPRWE